MLNLTPDLPKLSLLALLTLPLAACEGGGEKQGDDTAGTTEDYAHAIVPEEYRGSWDVESANCDDAIYYWAFEGSIDDNGNFEGTESWYWFFNDDGAMGGLDDCVDAFNTEGQEEDTRLETPCFSCDREFTATWTLGETQCSWDGYENMFDNDDVDRLDAEQYEFIFLLDILNGDALLDQMNVWAYVQDDQSASAYIDRPISVGSYTPTGSDNLGAADLRWSIVEGQCVDIKD